MATPLVTHAVADLTPEQSLRSWLDEGLRAASWCRMDSSTGDIDPEWAAANADQPEVTSWVRTSCDWARRLERVAYDDVDDRLMTWTRGRHVRIFATARSPKASRASRAAVTAWLGEQGVVMVGGASDAA